MATKEGKLLIAREASDLAFRLSQAIQRDLIHEAMRRAVARNAQTVSAVDVEAAAAEFHIAVAGKRAGERAHGEEKRSGPDAA